MKIIKYKTLNRYNVGTDENPDWREGIGECILGYNEANLKLAQKEAYNGAYSIEEMEEDNTPTQLDIIEAQVTYTAMMTDTLLEV